MFSHFTLGSNDHARSEKFYVPVMATLNQVLMESHHGFMMFGPTDGGFPHLFVVQPADGLPATWGNGFHLAFNVTSTTAVDQFHAAAMAAGGIDEGAPGLRSIYAEDYYGTYVRDPDGNKLQAVCYTRGRSCGETGEVISHITLGYNDYERERRFYDAIMDVLGLVNKPEEGDPTSSGYAFADLSLPVLYLQPTFDGRPMTWGNGTMTGFKANTRDQVDTVHAAALKAGGTCEGPPGLRPHYSEHYYGAYFRDPAGNKLHVVCRAVE